MEKNKRLYTRALYYTGSQASNPLYVAYGIHIIINIIKESTFIETKHDSGLQHEHSITVYNQTQEFNYQEVVGLGRESKEN